MQSSDACFLDAFGQFILLNGEMRTRIIAAQMKDLERACLDERNISQRIGELLQKLNDEYQLHEQAASKLRRSVAQTLNMMNSLGYTFDSLQAQIQESKSSSSSRRSNASTEKEVIKPRPKEFHRKTQK